MQNFAVSFSHLDKDMILHTLLRAMLVIPLYKSIPTMSRNRLKVATSVSMLTFNDGFTMFNARLCRVIFIVIATSINDSIATCI